MSEKARRRENFSQEEKNIILNYVKNHCTVMEDKSGNAKMQIEKKQKWKELEGKMKTIGSTRTWMELKLAYQRWKVTAKKNVTAYKKYLKSTGGGPSIPEPSEMDFSIAEICPQDFDMDENTHDSDGQRSKDDHDDSTYHDDELISDSLTGTYILLEDGTLQSTDDATTSKQNEPKQDKPIAGSSLVRPLDNKSNEPAPKRRKKEMTAYEEALLELQKEKYNKAMEFMKLEHEAKIQSILAEQNQKQELHELQMQEILLRMKKYQGDN